MASSYYILINDNLLNNSNNKKFNLRDFFKENKKILNLIMILNHFILTKKYVCSCEISSFKSTLLKYRNIDNDLEKYLFSKNFKSEIFYIRFS